MKTKPQLLLEFEKPLPKNYDMTDFCKTQYIYDNINLLIVDHFYESIDND